jgi:hypothetical protein
MIQATPAQLNTAAKIAATQGLDFQSALNVVLTDPTTAAALESRANNAPSPAQFSGVDQSALIQAFERGQAAGRASYELEQREAARQKALEELQNAVLNNSTRIDELDGTNAALAVGFASHLDQHEAFNADPANQIDPAATRELILAELEKRGVRGNVRKALERLQSQPVATAPALEGKSA